MRPFVLYCGFLLLFLFSSSDLLADTPFYKSFNTENGLPSSEVYDVGFDRNGIPWFCTDRGISSFNGYELKTLTTQDGLSNNTMLDVFTARNGDLWFCGLDGSLNVFDGTSLKPFSGNDEIKRLIDSNMLVEDMVEAEDGRFYMIFRVTITNLLASMDPRTGEFKLENLDSLKARFRVVTAGLNQWLEINGQLLALGMTKSSARSGDGRIFFFPDNKEAQVVATRTSSDEMDRLRFQSKLYHLYWDDDHGLWMCSSKGLYLFPGGDFEKPPKLYFKGSAISRIEKDKDNIYWLTSLEKGVFMVPSFDFNLTIFPDGIDSGSKITSMDSINDQLICGTLDGQLITLDRELNSKLIFEDHHCAGNFTSAFRLGDSLIMGMMRVWWENGDPVIEKLENYRYHSFGYPLANGDVLWAGNQGIMVSRNRKDILSNPAWSHRIHSCLEVGDQIFLGCLDGLRVIDNNNYSKVRVFRPNEPLLQTRINDLKRDKYGNIWASTLGNGLLYITPDSVLQVSTEEGLVSNLANTVHCDSGHVWVATNKGLSLVAYGWEEGLMINEIENLTTADGLPVNSLLDVRLWNGLVWLATGKGLVSFSPNVIFERKVHPVPVVLESVVVNQDSFSLDGQRELSHLHNDLEFRFLGIALRPSSESMWYRYRLQSGRRGEPWSYTRDRSVRYLNLVPGKYTFEVAAQNRQGVWSDAAARFEFRIRPHFSQTFWFQSSMILLLGGALAGGFWFRSQQMERRAAETKKLQAAEIAALRSQMNPHFVFNSLNAIQNFIFRKDVRNANYFLSRFSRLMREGLLFSRCPQISLKQELNFLEAYLELEKMRFPDRFDYEIWVDPDLKNGAVTLPPFLCQPLLENAIKHGFKDISYKGKLVLEFRMPDPETLEILIVDNGCGIEHGKVKDEKPYHESLGLQIVRDRIALLNSGRRTTSSQFEIGNLAVEKGSGTRAVFTLALR